MSIKKTEVKVLIHGRRRILFERLKNKKDVSNSAILRELMDFYFANHPDCKDN